mmetsp:Transcript_11999/g.39561  ORF Transcript_11999/g.39561 Transcript_11999/m.39561 type:complete len:317 (+) Transcript_11999:60-1010(+)
MRWCEYNILPPLPAPTAARRSHMQKRDSCATGAGAERAPSTACDASWWKVRLPSRRSMTTGPGTDRRRPPHAAASGERRERNASAFSSSVHPYTTRRAGPADEGCFERSRSVMCSRWLPGPTTNTIAAPYGPRPRPVAAPAPSVSPIFGSMKPYAPSSAAPLLSISAPTALVTGVSRFDGSIVFSPAASADTPVSPTRRASDMRPPNVFAAGGGGGVAVGGAAASASERRRRSPCSGRRSAPAAARRDSNCSASPGGKVPGCKERRRATSSSSLIRSSAVPPCASAPPPVGSSSWESVCRSSAESARPSSNVSSSA